MWNVRGLAAVLLLAVCSAAGCATVNPKPMEIETPTADRHFIVATDVLIDT
jgi:hypothetical protein